MKITNQHGTFEVEAGRCYTLAGCGEMLLSELPEPPRKTTVTFRAHGGYNYFGSFSQIVKEATRADLDARHEQAAPRGLDCKDDSCWCRGIK